MRPLFGGVLQGLLGALDHAAHVAHALGALGLALVAGEDVARPGGAGLDGLTHVALTKTVAVADVQEADPNPRMRLVRCNRPMMAIASRSHGRG